MKRQRITLDRIAEIAGVSKGTVSRALNEGAGVSRTTRARVLEIARNLGYPVVSDDERLTLGVIISRNHRNSDTRSMTPYLGELLSGLMDASFQTGHRLELVAVNHEAQTDDQILQTILATEFDGYLLVQPPTGSTVPAQLEQRGTKCVTLGERLDDPNLNMVCIDEQTGAFEAVSTLIRAGHRRIAMIGLQTALRAQSERALGYREALEEAGIDFDPNIVAFHSAPVSSAAIHATLRRVLGLGEPPTAIFAAGSLIGLWVHKALRDEGIRIPEEISLIGFGQSPAHTLLSPALSTVQQPVYEMARQATEYLIAIILGKAQEPIQVRLGTSLVQRGSDALIASPAVN